MQAGKLRHRVTFDQPVPGQDNAGDEILTWTPAFTVWASVEPLTGREQMLAGQIVAEGSTRIRVRWSTDTAQINAKWRARHDGVVYNFVSVPEAGKMHRDIEIMAKSGVNDG